MSKLLFVLVLLFAMLFALFLSVNAQDPGNSVIVYDGECITIGDFYPDKERGEAFVCSDANEQGALYVDLPVRLHGYKVNGVSQDGKITVSAKPNGPFDITLRDEEYPWLFTFGLHEVRVTGYSGPSEELSYTLVNGERPTPTPVEPPEPTPDPTPEPPLEPTPEPDEDKSMIYLPIIVAR